VMMCCPPQNGKERSIDEIVARWDEAEREVQTAMERGRALEIRLRELGACESGEMEDLAGGLHHHVSELTLALSRASEMGSTMAQIIGANGTGKAEAQEGEVEP